MKNFKKFTAFVLALCMVFSLSISAFAAEKTPTGYLTWTLDDSGTLIVSGNGRIAAFTSAEDQPCCKLQGKRADKAKKLVQELIQEEGNDGKSHKGNVRT